MRIITKKSPWLSFILPAGVFFFSVIDSHPATAATTASLQKLSVGERLVYSVRWLGLEVGKGEVEVEEKVILRGREVYPIVVHVRSAPILDWIYKVRDVHHSYIDAEKFHTLRYEKILREGHYWADEVMDYDQDRHTANYHSRLNGSRKEMLIPPDVQDQLSCGFWFRLQEIHAGDRIHIPVNADEKNWDLQVKVHEKSRISVKPFGEVEAFEIEPEIQFQGIFVKRGKIRGWIEARGLRIPLRMKVKIPILGSVTAQLIEYQKGEDITL